MFHSFTDITKGSPVGYKTASNSATSTPTKDTLSKYDRNFTGPVLPNRGGTLMGGSGLSSSSNQANHHHYSAPINFRKGFSGKCSWKCTAIAVIMLCIVLTSVLVYMSG